MARRQRHSGPPEREVPAGQGRLFLSFGALTLLAFFVFSIPDVQQAIVEPFSLVVARLAGELIQLFGGRITIRDDILIVPGFAARIVGTCTGIEPTLLLWSALLVFPAPWTYKLKGMILGFLTIQIFNLMRAVTLIYLGAWDRAWFEWVHLYVWPTILIAIALVSFMAWLSFMPVRVADEATA